LLPDTPSCHAERYDKKNVNEIFVKIKLLRFFKVCRDFGSNFITGGLSHKD
jgi:hypothetical protein